MYTKTINILIALMIIIGGSGMTLSQGLVIIGETTNGTIDIDAHSAEWIYYIDLTGFDVANVDTNNNWGVHNEIRYDGIVTGVIHVSVNDKQKATSEWNDFYYYDWFKMVIDGNGIYVPPNDGCRRVEITNSTNITGWIEYYAMTHKAVFICDTRDRPAFLTVLVTNNGEIVEGVRVDTKNGHHEILYTSNEGYASCKPASDFYTVKVNGTTIVENMYLESGLDYLLHYDLTTGLDLFEKEQVDYIPKYIELNEYANYWRDRYVAGDHSQVVTGTIRWISEEWGAYSEPEMEVLLHNYTVDGTDVTLEIWNFAHYPCSYAIGEASSETVKIVHIDEIGAIYSNHGKQFVTLQNLNTDRIMISSIRI